MSAALALPRPYYEAGGVTIYHGDCAELLPGLGAFDLLLTDPPYGIGADAVMHKQGGKKFGRSVTTRTAYADTNWDASPPSRSLLDLCRSKATHQIIFGGNYFELPPSRCWLVWDKETGANRFADAELVWTNLDKAVRLKRYLWAGMLQGRAGHAREARLHPTQKPMEVIAWVMSHAPDGITSVLDPFMGSGTTLRVAKDRGLAAVGIEREERYCEIAANRLRQEVLF